MGDTTSFNGVYSEEANQECAEYLNSPKALVNVQKQLTIGGISDIASIAIFNYTRNPT